MNVLVTFLSSPPYSFLSLLRSCQISHFLILHIGQLKNLDYIRGMIVGTTLLHNYVHVCWSLQLGNFEEGAKCFYTFMFHNMKNDLIPGNDRFYRKTLELGTEEYVWREPPTQPHQDLFLEGQSRPV